MSRGETRTASPKLVACTRPTFVPISGSRPMIRSSTPRRASSMFSHKLAASLALLAAAAAAPNAQAAEPAIDGTSPLKAASDAYRSVYPQMSIAAADRAAAGAAVAQGALRRARRRRDVRRRVVRPAVRRAARRGHDRAAAADAATARAVQLGAARRDAARRAAASPSSSARPTSCAAAPARSARPPTGRSASTSQTNQVVVAVPAGAARGARRPAAAGRRPVDRRPGIADVRGGRAARRARRATGRSGPARCMWRATSGNTVLLGRLHRPATQQPRYVYTAGHCSNGNGVHVGHRRAVRSARCARRWTRRRRRGDHPGHEPVVHRRLGGQIYSERPHGGTVAVDRVAPTLATLVPARRSACRRTSPQPTGRTSAACSAPTATRPSAAWRAWTGSTAATATAAAAGTG